MTSKFISSPKNFRQRKDLREFPKGKTGLIFCKVCKSVYFKKSWHHNLRHYKNFEKDAPIKFATCPACQMIKNRQFEGEIIIENAPAKISGELINLIKNFTRQSYLKDPLDRLIEIKKTNLNIIAKLTENQTAVKLAKKINSVYRKTEMKISYSHQPSDVVYIKIEFK